MSTILYFLAGVHYRCMIPAPKGLAYLCSGVLGYFPRYIHGKLAGINNALGAFFPLQIVGGKVEFLCDHPLDYLHRQI